MTTDTQTIESVEASPSKQKRSPLRLAWSAVGTIFTFIAVVICTLALVVAVSSHFSSKGEYSVFGHPIMSMLSGSMTPVIRTGDLVYDDVISPSQAESLHAGQIISFYSPGTKLVFTHRIHAVEHVNGSVLYQTKGDANNAPDSLLVPPANVVGLYAGKVPFGGYILYDLHKPIVLILLFAAPLLWLVSGWLYQLAKEADERGQVPALAGEREVVPV